jgi:iron complex transport system substrate-binding protein
MTTVRSVATALSLVLVLAACGTGGEDHATRAEEPSTRVVETAYGEVKVPAEPQRIVGDLMTVDYLSALDYDTSRIVGVFDRDFFADDHYLADVLHQQHVVDVGTAWEPNLEAIAAARPDVILLPFDQIDGSDVLDELRAIAPLVAVPTSQGGTSREVRYGGAASFQDWRSTIRAYGEILDMADEADAFVEATEGRIADVREEHGDLIAATTVTEAKSTPDHMAINALDAAKEAGVLGSILLRELGFSAPPQQDAIAPDEYGGIDLSAENIALVDGDLLFLEVRSGATAHEESPLWRTLGVVEHDGVVLVGNHWEFGGATAARVVLDDIDRALDALAERS